MPERDITALHIALELQHVGASGNLFDSDAVFGIVLHLHGGSFKSMRTISEGLSAVVGWSSS